MNVAMNMSKLASSEQQAMASSAAQIEKLGAAFDSVRKRKDAFLENVKEGKEVIKDFSEHTGDRLRAVGKAFQWVKISAGFLLSGIGKAVKLIAGFAAGVLDGIVSRAKNAIDAFKNSQMELTTAYESLTQKTSANTRASLAQKGIYKDLGKATAQATAMQLYQGISQEASTKAVRDMTRATDKQLLSLLKLNSAQDVAKARDLNFVNDEGLSIMRRSNSMLNEFGVTANDVADIYTEFTKSGQATQNVAEGQSMMIDMMKAMERRAVTMGKTFDREFAVKSAKDFAKLRTHMFAALGDVKEVDEVLKKLTEKQVAAGASFVATMKGARPELDRTFVSGSVAMQNINKAFDMFAKHGEAGLVQGLMPFMDNVNKLTKEGKLDQASTQLQWLSSWMNNAFGDETGEAVLRIIKRMGQMDAKTRAAALGAQGAATSIGELTDKTWRSTKTLAEIHELNMGAGLKRFRALTRETARAVVRESKQAFADFNKAAAEVSSEKSGLGLLVNMMSRMHQVGIFGILPKQMRGTGVVAQHMLNTLGPALDTLSKLGLNASDIFSPHGALITGLGGYYLLLENAADAAEAEVDSIRKSKNVRRQFLTEMEKLRTEQGKLTEGTRARWKVDKELHIKQLQLNLATSGLSKKSNEYANAVARIRAEQKLLTKIDAQDWITTFLKSLENISNDLPEIARKLNYEITAMFLPVAGQEGSIESKWGKSLKKIWSNLAEAWPSISSALGTMWSKAFRAFTGGTGWETWKGEIYGKLSDLFLDALIALSTSIAWIAGGSLLIMGLIVGIKAAGGLLGEALRWTANKALDWTAARMTKSGDFSHFIMDTVDIGMTKSKPGLISKIGGSLKSVWSSAMTATEPVMTERLAGGLRNAMNGIKSGIGRFGLLGAAFGLGLYIGGLIDDAVAKATSRNSKSREEGERTIVDDVKEKSFHLQAQAIQAITAGKDMGQIEKEISDSWVEFYMTVHKASRSNALWASKKSTISVMEFAKKEEDRFKKSRAKYAKAKATADMRDWYDSLFSDKAPGSESAVDSIQKAADAVAAPRDVFVDVNTFTKRTPAHVKKATEAFQGMATVIRSDVVQSITGLENLVKKTTPDIVNTFDTMWDKIEKRSAMAVKDLSNKLQEVLRNLRKAKIGLEAATAKPSDTTDYEGGRKSALSAATNASAAEVQLINSIHKPDWYVNYKFEFNQMMSELIQAVKDQPQPQTSDNKPATKKPDASGVKPR